MSRDQALRLWSGSTDSKTLDYQRTNLREEIIVENFPNMEKEIVNQVQEEQTVPYRINRTRNRSRHIEIKLTKAKHKEKILKSAK